MDKIEKVRTKISNSEDIQSLQKTPACDANSEGKNFIRATNVMWESEETMTIFAQDRSRVKGG
jgi:hypothetical protein